MFVDLTLYKTKIDEENIFVGLSKADRQTTLDAITEKVEWNKASYNPNYPFRIYGNYLEYQRKYNYLKYEFFMNATDTNPIQTRYYFVRDFQYVADDITNMVVVEDLISDIYYDLSFARFQPQVCTYNTKYINKETRMYKQLDINGLFKIEDEGDLLLKKTFDFMDGKGNQTFVFGFLLFSCLFNEVKEYHSETNILPKYQESFFRMPFYNVVLPFAFNNTTKQFSTIPFEFDAGGNTQRQLILSAKNYNDFLSNTSPGFSIITSLIYFDTKGMFDISLNEDKTTYVLSEIKSDVYDFVAGSYYSVDGQYLNSVLLLQSNNEDLSIQRGRYIEINKPILPDFLYWQPNYVKMCIYCEGNKTEIDPRRRKEFSNNLMVKQSFTPPYEYNLSWLDIDNQYNVDNFIKGQYTSSFIEFNDAYADWYKQNYNSQIVGLQTQHKYEKKLQGVKTAFRYANLGVDVATTAGKISAGTIKGKNAQKNSIIDLGVDAAKTVLDDMQDWVNLSINHAKENELQQLQIQDIINTPDNISMEGIIGTAWYNKSYMRLTLELNQYYDQIIAYHKAFGFESFFDISENIKQHNLFDYYRCTDMVLKQNELQISEVERGKIEATFQGGIRIWYDYANMKDFNAVNGEYNE